MSKTVCLNQGKKFAGCTYNGCCFYCENVQECSLLCDTVDNFEGHEKPEEECKYCREECKLKEG